MDYRRFGNQIVLRVDRDEEVMTEITALCEQEHIRLASISGLGAADHLVMIQSRPRPMRVMMR